VVEQVEDPRTAKGLVKREIVEILTPVEDPRTAKGLVKREIVEILTPGTATVDGVDAQRQPSCLVAVYEKNDKALGLAALDITTGAFTVDEGSADEIVPRSSILIRRKKSRWKSACSFSTARRN